MSKKWILIILLVATVVSVGSLWAKPSMMVQTSTAPGQKSQRIFRNTGALFLHLGVGPSQNGILNPCMEIEDYSNKWCSKHAIKLILDKENFVDMEKQLLKGMLQHDNACEQVSLYLGRVCEQENFLKIFNHFALRK